MSFALATIEQAQIYMGSAAPDVEVLQTLLDAASAHIENFLEQPVNARNIVEVIDGNGQDMVVVQYTPIIAVTAVRACGYAVAPWAEGVPLGYMVRNNAIIYVNGKWPRGRASLVVEYRAGFEQIPADLRQACLELVALRASETGRFGVSSKSLAGETITYTLRDLPASTQAVLRDYRKVTW